MCEQFLEILTPILEEVMKRIMAVDGYNLYMAFLGDSNKSEA